MSLFNRFNWDKLSEQILSTSIVSVYCQTCNKRFLRITCADFLAKTRMRPGVDGAEPDRWAVETLLHWMEDNSHEVIFSWPHVQVPDLNISDMWRALWERQGQFLPDKVQLYVDSSRYYLI